MSASFRKAELIRMGKGYFWKSLGKSTTASHCSPIFPERNPGIKTIQLVTTQQGCLKRSVIFRGADTLRGQQTDTHNAIKEPCASLLASWLAYPCPAPWEQSWRPALVRHNKLQTEKSEHSKTTSLPRYLIEKFSLIASKRCMSSYCTTASSTSPKPEVKLNRFRSAVLFFQ